MGLIMKRDMFPEAYLRITSYEYHIAKKYVRVRIEMFPNVGVAKGSVQVDWVKKMTEEIKLTEKEFQNYSLAKTKIKDADAKAIADRQIKDAEAGLLKAAQQDEELHGLTKIRMKTKFSAEEKSTALTNAKENLIAVEAKLLGTENMDSLIKNLDEKKSVETLYTYLKKTERYAKAKDG